mgnify:CR=1 FL=1
MQPKYQISELFLFPRDQPTGETILDAVINVLRDTPAIWPEEIAKQLEVRKEHLSGAIKILTGVSLEKMIREWRMRQAMYLIKTTDIPFDEIAQQCGYSQTKTLTQSMEHYLHMTPYEYRNGCHREQIRRFRKSNS